MFSPTILGQILEVVSKWILYDSNFEMFEDHSDVRGAPLVDSDDQVS